MRPRIHPVVVLCASMMTAPMAAQTTASPSGAPSTPLPSVTLPPALERVLRDYERAWRTRDNSALAALFAEDGFVLQGGRAPVRGRMGIRAAYAGQGGPPLRLRALAAATADTVGYIIGAYGYGDTPGDQGKFTLTLRRAPDGAWQIFSDIDNQSQPPRRAGGSSPTTAPNAP